MMRSRICRSTLQNPPTKSGGNAFRGGSPSPPAGERAGGRGRRLSIWQRIVNEHFDSNDRPAPLCHDFGGAGGRRGFWRDGPFSDDFKGASRGLGFTFSLLEAPDAR